MLSLLMAKACSSGNCTGDSIHFAASVELLHNATLLHDDVADQADTRRGFPTVRSLMGPSSSVLVGDFWLVRSLASILDSKKEHHDKALKLFSATLSDLAQGEMLQLQKASTADTTFEDYLDIIYRKTSSIFVCACRSGALSVDAPLEYMDAAGEYAKYLGYAFQMKDDIFDYQPQSQAGKPVGVDILEQKITLPLLVVMKEMTENERDGIRSKIRNITPGDRDEIIELVRSRGGLEKALAVSNEYCAKAVAALAPLPESKAKQYLEGLVDYVVNREK